MFTLVIWTLATSLPRMPSLRVLGLSHLHLDDSVVESLLRALLQLPDISFVDLRSFDFLSHERLLSALQSKSPR